MKFYSPISHLSFNGTFALWKRNFIHFKKNFLHSFFWVILEPIFFLLAIGYGLGSLVGEVEQMSYLKYFTPALLITSAMFITFLESSHSCYNKLHDQKIYQSILLTPVSVLEITFCEILWGLTKAFFGVIPLIFIFYFQNLIPVSFIFLIPSLIIFILLCWIFSALGLYLSFSLSSDRYFTYFYSGLILPLAFFSETYFPLSKSPQLIQVLSHLFPVSHATISLRETLIKNQFPPFLLLSLSVLLAYALILTLLSLQKIKQKLTQ